MHQRLKATGSSGSDILGNLDRAKQQIYQFKARDHGDLPSGNAVYRLEIVVASGPGERVDALLILIVLAFFCPSADALQSYSGFAFQVFSAKTLTLESCLSEFFFSHHSFKILASHPSTSTGSLINHALPAHLS